MTALMMAVKNGLITIVNTLVEGHADINIQENVSPAVESCGLYTARLIGRHQPFIYVHVYITLTICML